MPAPLHEDAAQFIRSRGLPMTNDNLNRAMNQLTENPNLRPSYAGSRGGQQGNQMQRGNEPTSLLPDDIGDLQPQQMHIDRQGEWVDPNQQQVRTTDRDYFDETGRGRTQPGASDAQRRERDSYSTQTNHDTNDDALPQGFGASPKMPARIAAQRGEAAEARLTPSGPRLVDDPSPDNARRMTGMHREADVFDEMDTMFGTSQSEAPTTSTNIQDRDRSLADDAIEAGRGDPRMAAMAFAETMRQAEHSPRDTEIFMTRMQDTFNLSNDEVSQMLTEALQR